MFAERETYSMLIARKRCLLAALDQIVARREWGHDDWRDYQASALRALLMHANAHVPFYRAKYAAADFNPATFRTLDDLERIPMVTKAELRNASLGSLKSTASRQQLRLLSSSGSTGTPLRLFREEASLWHFTARNMGLYHHWCAGRPIGNVLYFIDLTPGSIDYALADLLRTTVMAERIVPISQPTSALVDAIDKYRPEFISSYPSTLRNIAMLMHRRREAYPELRLLHTTSEMLDQGARSLLGKAFPNARIVETYTTTEAGLVACPCAEAGRLHLAGDGVIAEIVDAQGKPTSTVGEIVVTDLTNWSTPIIRYRGLGDFCRRDDAMCSCGSPFASLGHLEGRQTESITLPNGTMASPYALINVLEELPGIYQFQVIQETATSFELRIIHDDSSGLAEAAVSRAAGDAIKRLIPEARCRVQFVAAIVPEKGRHKVPLVVSRLRSAL